MTRTDTDHGAPITGAHRRTTPSPRHAYRRADARASSGDRPALGTEVTSEQRRRLPEIDGLRGVAIALIVVYHIWLHRVSGGVDVFLFLSGLLITGTLLRSAARPGRPWLLTYYARIARRIVPPALVVLLGVVIAAILFLPATRWRDTLTEVVASALYVVNWHLAGNAVDYLASQQAASPVQHYWSLAIQGQFYLLWPALIGAAVALAARRPERIQPIVTALLGVVFAGSLAYSIHRTATDQVFTYFDTGARLWEFALGGLVWLLLPKLRLPVPLAAPLSWLGLFGLLSCGLVFREGNEFPGWAALWPTLAAALLVASAGSGGQFGADRLLRGRTLRWLGKHSFAWYLWHWPVLICYLAVTGYTTATIRGGLLVLAASLALAVITTWLLEVRLPASGLGQKSNRDGFALAATAVALVLATTAGWHGYLTWQQNQAAAGAAQDYPGARYLAEGGILADVPYRPDPLSAADDRADVYDLGCHQGLQESEVLTCEFGRDADTAEYTLAVVGGSHSAHWLPALQELAEPHRWRIVSITKSACRFEPVAPAPDDPQQHSCHEWNLGVLDLLAELRPDAVFTTATTGQGGREHTPPGYLPQWQRVTELDIPVLAIRDVAWPQINVPDCVAQHGPENPTCGADRAAHDLDRPAEVATSGDLPDQVHILDLTDYLCGPDFCPPIIGNVLVYHDDHHLSATYARTLAPYLAEEIVAATGWPPA